MAPDKLTDVLEIPIAYAEKGVPVLPQIASTIAGVRDLFEEHWESSAAIYLREGVPRPRTMLRNQAVADTYSRILREAQASGGNREARIDAARDCFYHGFVAEEIDSYLASTLARDSSGRDHAGLLSGQDMANWSASREDPASFIYGDLEVCKTGPWGQGPVLLQQLALLAGFDLGAMGHNSVDYVHTVVECAKLAFADREAWYGDPDFADVPLRTLLSPEYADERRRLVGDSASFELRPGRPDGREPLLPGLKGGVTPTGGIGEPTVPTVGDTCHLDIADSKGNVVSATPSGGWLQSSPVVPALGFPLGTRAQAFWLEPGLPNSLAPGKRPRSTLTPSIALAEGVPRIAFGSPGGDQQDQWSLNFFLAVREFGLDMQQSIDSPQFHSLNAPSSFYPRQRHAGRLEVEGRMDQDVIDGLRARGHDVVVGGDWEYGRVCAVSRDGDGIVRGAASPRGMQSYAMGR